MSVKKYVTSAMLALSVMCTAMPARAGIPTIDIAAITQAIMQVQAWSQQYQQMVQQFQQLQQQFQQMEAMTNKLDGARSLGSILNDPAIKSALPVEMRDATQLLLNPSAFGTSQANIDGILASYGVSTTTDPNAGKSSADAMGRAQAILTSAQQRQIQLQALGAQVDGSVDAKSSLDLLNRNTLEVANINNTSLQTQAALEATRQSAELRRLAAQQSYAKAVKNASAAPLRTIN